jgi:hypothetical protein
VIAGFIALSLVGLLQSLGPLADTVPIDPTWRSAAEDERGHAAGSGSVSLEALRPAAIRAPYRGEPTFDVLVDPAAYESSVRLRSRASRAPPALLSRASR